MTDKQKIKEMQTSLQVIQTWADYYHENWYKYPDLQQRKNLEDIKELCKRTLEKVKD